MFNMNKITGNLILVGLMGAGKTTLGKQLANKLQLEFYDSDQVICERTGVSIPTIFELEGETGFRQREKTIINELVQLQNIIIATGGGTVLHEENRDKLKENGFVIYLHALPEILLSRIQHDKNRPLLQVKDPMLKLQQLYTQRDRLYRATAHLVIEANDSCTSETMTRLCALLRQTNQQ
jgi:shikimate kinase